MIGYSSDKNFDENKFKDHIKTYLSAERINNVTIKIFTDINTYLSRIKSLEGSDDKDRNTLTVLKQLVL